MEELSIVTHRDQRRFFSRRYLLLQLNTHRMKTFARNALKRLNHACNSDQGCGESTEAIASTLCRDASDRAAILGLPQLVRVFGAYVD